MTCASLKGSNQECCAVSSYKRETRASYTLMISRSAQRVRQGARHHMQAQFQCFACCPAEVAVRKLAGAQGPEGAQPRQRRKRRGAASTAAAPAEAAAGEGGVAVPSASEAVQAGCTLWDLADAAAALEREAEAGQWGCLSWLVHCTCSQVF